MRTRSVCFLAALLLAACVSSPPLHEEDFLRVTPGMTREDVRRTLGEPSRTESFARQRQVAWDYPYVDLWGYTALVSVIFDADGRVVGKVHTRKEPEDE